MGAIQFWLINEGKRIQLPVNPEVMSVASPFGFEDVEVAQLGEITVIGDVKLREVSFSTFFPREYNPTYCEYSNLPRPMDIYNLLERWKRERKPIRFTVTGTIINFDVTIREFTAEPEKAGSPGDVYFTISLKEYRHVTVKKVNEKNGKASTSKSNARPAPPKKSSQSYGVKSGDSLWKIAAREYGDGSQWRKIYDANKGVIGKNPNSLKPGQKLVIPK
jgi:hypothetical protein